MKITYFELLEKVFESNQPKKIKVGTATYTWNGCDYILNTDSRRSLSDTLTSWTTKAQTTAEFIEVVEELLTIECAPTVEAEPKWIPVTYRLPEDNRGKQIIITLDPSYGDGKRMVSRCAYFTHGRFYSCESDGVYMNSAVKAWMPLPEPYEVKHE